MHKITKHYINGEFAESHGTELLDLVDPVTEEIVTQVTLGDEEDVNAAVAAAKAAFPAYSQTSIAERQEILQRLHDVVTARADEHVKMMMEEYGGSERISTFAVHGAGQIFLNMRANLGEVPFEKDFGISQVSLKPLGVAALITPWNADILMICQKVAPALAAGCTVVVKPSELSARQTQLLLECFDAAGLPRGVINLVNGRGEVVGNALTLHPDVAKVSFTGSTVVGKTVMRNASETIKRVTLELGGKSASIILEDANLEQAIPFVLRAGFMNSGQACICGTRVLVPQSRLDEVKQALAKEMDNFQVGKPADPRAAIGPMVTRKQYDRVQGYIRAGIDEGAEVLVGGPGLPDGFDRGYFTKPTIFVNVSNDMKIAREEIFGPVLSVIAYKDEDDAIAIANDSSYGLHGWLSTRDAEHGREVAGKIEAGTIMINDNHDMYSERHTPAGGFKQSGIGREFGVYGIEEYLQTQSRFEG
jgi:aldehyde dehydrogenase (NAD+)